MALGTSSQTANKRHVLIVEDEALVCMLLESILDDAGYAVATANFIEEALAMIDGNPPDAAILDLNLRGKKVYPVAERLVALGIPFAFATGGGLDVEGYANYAKIGKPFREVEVVDAVARLFADLESDARQSAE